MSNHLPECPWPAHPCSHTTMHDREPLFCVDCLTECICDRLRACEHRVLSAAYMRVIAVENDPDAEIDYDRDYRRDPTGNTREPRMWMYDALRAIADKTASQ